MTAPVSPVTPSATTLFDGTSRLGSQLPRVTDERWMRFVHALSIEDADTAERGRPRSFGARSPGGGLGCFDLRPKRLADIGMARNVRDDNTSGRRVTVCDFIAPMTLSKFLRSPIAQYNALVESIRRYDRRLDGVVLPEGMTRSGALALHHRLGPHALTKWQKHQEPTTARLFGRVNGLF